MSDHHDTPRPYSRPATARERMIHALTEYGITAHVDRDAGNSWLLVNADGDSFPDAGTPMLIVFVYDAREASAFVDQPMEHRAGTWRVTFHDGARERDVFYGPHSDPATATEQCAKFIAEYLAAPRA